MTGKTQTNKKGNIQYLLNEQLSLTPADLLDIFAVSYTHLDVYKRQKVAFVIGKRGDGRLMELYVNGNRAGAAIYDNSRCV